MVVTIRSPSFAPNGMQVLYAAIQNGRSVLAGVFERWPRTANAFGTEREIQRNRLGAHLPDNTCDSLCEELSRSRALPKRLCPRRSGATLAACSSVPLDDGGCRARRWPGSLGASPIRDRQPPASGNSARYTLTSTATRCRRIGTRRWVETAAQYPARTTQHDHRIEATPTSAAAGYNPALGERQVDAVALAVMTSLGVSVEPGSKPSALVKPKRRRTGQWLEADFRKNRRRRYRSIAASNSPCSFDGPPQCVGAGQPAVPTFVFIPGNFHAR